MRYLIAQSVEFDSHPSQHGGFEIEFEDSDGVISHADLSIGNVHRSAEKLFEARDYRQALMLADRHDWTSAFTSELGLAIAVERSLGITVPARAQRIRTLLSELFRINAGLLFLTHRLELRESLLELFARYSGQRIHPMATRIGGVAFDVREDWLADVVTWLTQDFNTDEIRAAADVYTGIGVLENAESFGVSGPVARAAGLEVDTRFTEPYDEYPIGAPLRLYSESDTRARIHAMCDGLDQSLELAKNLVIDVPPGEISVKLPKVVKVPEGSYTAATESAIGTNRYFLVSDAKKEPLRLKIRSASFNNASALAAALRDTPTMYLAAVVKSFFLVAGDSDR